MLAVLLFTRVSEAFFGVSAVLWQQGLGASSGGEGGLHPLRLLLPEDQLPSGPAPLRGQNILANLAYAFMSGPVSAVLVTIAVGFTYMTANLIQLDLAARVCTPETAGTTFALLMPLCNLSYSLSEALGGHLYDGLGARFGFHAAFSGLVVVGAASTALCWTMFPLLRRHAPTQ